MTTRNDLLFIFIQMNDEFVRCATGVVVVTYIVSNRCERFVLNLGGIG